MVTEDQARTKWCPFARVEIESEGGAVCSANRLPGVGGSADPDLEWPSPRCIASECMAWRDAGEHPEDTSKAETEFRRTGRRLTTRRLGYCGLAGSPRP